MEQNVGDYRFPAGLYGGRTARPAETEIEPQKDMKHDRILTGRAERNGRKRIPSSRRSPSKLAAPAGKVTVFKA